jgi:hypothetical protein
MFSVKCVPAHRACTKLFMVKLGSAWGSGQLTRPVLNVQFDVFMAVAMKNGVSWDVTPCGSCKNRRFGGI